MAKAYQCDRCGAFFMEYCGRYKVTLKIREIPKDLCQKCSEEIENWMKNEADFMPKEENKEDVQQNV